ncbi:YaaC family protein [Agrobacterium radiobacter]
MDSAKRARMDYLRRDADSKILGHLKSHGWNANVEREVLAGEYLIIVAERGGYEHRIALLYSCATGNETYKLVANDVEYIFYNGEPYQQDSYAYGLDKPVGPVSGFFDLLVEWNKESADGLFAAVDVKEEVEANRGLDYRLLLSETPIEAIWLRLRQFQSVSLAEKLVKDRAARSGLSLGEEVKTKAEGLAFSLRNAADYYKADAARTVSQRILNLYYGTMSFSFAEMLAAPKGPTTLAEIEKATKQGHGLYVIDGENENLSDIVVGALRSGFFGSWLHSLEVDTGGFPEKRPKKFSDLESTDANSWTTIESLFARIPEISDLFLDIFDSPSLWLQPTFDFIGNPHGFLASKPRTNATTYAIFTDSSGRLSKEDVARFPGAISDIQIQASEDGARRFRVAVDGTGKKTWWDALPLYRSPLGRTAIILPIFHGIGDFRIICFTILYALSIVVRYRPSLWRRVQEGDLDEMRVLIEAFLVVAERVLPEQFLGRIVGKPVIVKQPNAFF